MFQITCYLNMNFSWVFERYLIIVNNVPYSYNEIDVDNWEKTKKK